MNGADDANLHRDNAAEIVLRLVRFAINLPIRIALRVSCKLSKS